MQIINYSDKAIALIGNTKPVKEQLTQMFGKYNPNLKHPETGEVFKGWVFSKKREAQLKQFIESACNAASQPKPEPKPDPLPNTKPEPKPTTSKSELFFKTALSLQTQADKKYRELSCKLANTPKRQREYNDKKYDADQLAELADIYKAFGRAIQENTLPELLKPFSPQIGKEHIKPFIRATESSGYYDVHRSEFLYYQRYFHAIPEIGMNTPADADQLYKAITSLVNPVDPAKEHQNSIQKLIDGLKFLGVEGFFPTPENIATQMVYEADIEDGHTVLEPSAGIGSIADVIRNLCPDASLQVCEQNYDMSKILKLKGFEVISESNFLQVYNTYDRIIMNPPFEHGLDTEHVTHAFRLLNPGGKVVAIVSEGCFLNQQGKYERFRNLVDQYGYSIPLPAGSFNLPNAFRRTGVNTRMVVLDKK